MSIVNPKIGPIEIICKLQMYLFSILNKYRDTIVCEVYLLFEPCDNKACCYIYNSSIIQYLTHPFSCASLYFPRIQYVYAYEIVIYIALMLMKDALKLSHKKVLCMLSSLSFFGTLHNK